MTDVVHSQFTGRKLGLGTGFTSNAVQFHRYTYDTLGNVRTRLDWPDDGTRRHETYTYDGLNRLTGTSLQVGPEGSAVVTAESYTYDPAGNLRSKTGVGTYAYDGPRPHAVSSITGGAAMSARTFHYDGVGNLLTDGVRTFTWTSDNKLQRITQGSLQSDFWFDSGGQRFMQRTASDRTTYYVSALFEHVKESNGVEERKFYVMTPMGRTAMRLERNNATVETRWFHQDNLGSIVAVTNELGAVVTPFSYDSWGKREALAGTQGSVTRGYTDHEHLDDFGLIHMNGRVYDPVLGRFLSADPFVDDAGDSQSYNRYSYVSNNPLGYTDPSGYFKLKDVVKIVAIVAIAYFTAGAAISAWGATSVATTTTVGTSFTVTVGNSALASSLLASGVSAGVINGAIGGLAAGFASGFAGSLLNGSSVGDAFKAGAIGGLSGMFTGGALGAIGGTGLNSFGRGLAHGAVHGGAAEATGGEFRHGFFSGFAVGATEMKLGEWSHKSSGRGFAAAAVVGGTASALGGGKFANGALSGAFSFLFNYMSVERVSGPDYDPEVFGDDETNCVAYGMNARGTVRLGSNNTSMGELVEAAKALGMIEPYSNGLLSLPNGAIEVVIAPAQWTNTRYGTKIRDHHVFRRDSNGAYSHKFSGSRATNLDGSGNVIYNLRNANLTFRVPPRSGVTGYARGIRFDYEVQIDKAVTLWYVPR